VFGPRFLVNNKQALFNSSDVFVLKSNRGVSSTSYPIFGTKRNGGHISMERRFAYELIYCLSSWF